MTFNYGDIVIDTTYNGMLQGKFLRSYIISPEEHPANHRHERAVVQWLSNNGKLLKDPLIDDLSIDEIKHI